MIIDFKHNQGGHCETTVTSNLLRFNNLNSTEAMVLGVGAGIYFTYLPFIKVQFAPLITFRSIPNQIFQTACKQLGIQYKVLKFKTPAEAMSALEENLQKGIPTGIQVGVYHLPFFPPEYRMQYNMHNMICYGMENGKFLISDSVMEEPQWISYDDLARVRFAKGAFAPKGKMYFMTHVPSDIDLKMPIYKGIKKACYNMTKIPFWLVGTKGIHALAKDVKKWPEKQGNEKASFFLGQILRMMEEVGTGGAGYRFMFTAFLQEASGHIFKDELMSSSLDFVEICKKWRAFTSVAVKNCKNRSKPTEDYGMLSDILHDIAEAEHQAFKKLDKVKM